MTEAKRSQLESLGVTLASNHLDALRGLSALAVCAGHCRNLFYLDLSQGESNIFCKMFYLFTSLGHEAVVVFFVLSGFFIARQVLSWFVSNRFSWKKYLAHRLVRLYIVLIPCLVLTAVWDRLGLTVFRSTDSIYYGDPLGSAVITSDLTQNMGWSVFVGNALFLQDVICKPFGSNTPLWSLSYEFWYYMIFPMLFSVRRQDLSLMIRIFAVSVALLLIFILPAPIRLYFLIWSLGAGVNFLPTGTGTRRSNLILILPAGTLFAFGLIQAKLRLIAGDPFLSDFVMALCMLPLLIVILRCRSNGPSWYARVTHVLASFSFTLYLAHLPALVLLRQALMNDAVSRWSLSLGSLLAGLVIFLAVVAYAHCLATVCEFRTNFVRDKLFGKS